MRDILDKIYGLFRLERRDRTALLLSLLSACVIWLIINMVQPYTDVLSIPVRINSNLDGYSVQSENEEDVIASCELSGFWILRLRVLSRHGFRTVDVPKEHLHKYSNGSFYLLSKDLPQYSRAIFGDEAVVRSYLSDTLFYRFTQVSSKKVPVFPDTEIVFSPQYTNVGPFRFDPDSVTIHGDPARLASIDRVLTSRVRLNKVSKDVAGVVRLRPQKGVRLSDDNVRYRLDVSRYVEIGTQVRLKVNGVPQDRTLYAVPQKVDVSFRCKFPLQCNPERECVFYVDWEDFVSSRTGICPVKCSALPGGVISYSVNPETVDCIVGEKL